MTDLVPAYQDGGITVYQGDACEVLRQLPDRCATICLTDPPYSSGGFVRSDRNASVRNKYQNSGTVKRYADFSGDSRDQLSFIAWASVWMNELRRVVQPGGVFGCFVDWRNIACIISAIQSGGWVYRGIVPWHKPSSRPILGRYRNAAEYLVWGTNGPREVAGPAVPGLYRHHVNAATKRHVTEKPVPLMYDLLGIAYEPDACVMDPFVGSGTTLRAAQMRGIRGIGIENSAEILATCIERVSEPLEATHETA